MSNYSFGWILTHLILKKNGRRSRRMWVCEYESYHFRWAEDHGWIARDHAGSRWDHPCSRHETDISYCIFYMIMNDHDEMVRIWTCQGDRDHEWLTMLHAVSRHITSDPAWLCMITQDQEISSWFIMNHDESEWSLVNRPDKGGFVQLRAPNRPVYHTLWNVLPWRDRDTSIIFLFIYFFEKVSHILLRE